MKKLLTLFIPVLIVLAGFSCAGGGEENQIHAQIIDHKYFPNLSSASGVAFFDGNIYLVGDDLPFLFTLDEEWNVIRKQQVSGIDSLINGRSPKSLKADFESLALLDEAGKKQLLILSSGSGNSSRDTAFLLSLFDKGSITKKNMRPLFDLIKQTAGLKSENKINIEGLAFSDKKAWLLHRGNVSENFIVEIGRGPFLAFIRSEDTLLPQVKVHHFNLPADKGVAAGFSGACVLPSYSGMLFTASLENTSNETDDGAVLGSYFGFIPFAAMNEGKFTATLLTENGRTLAKKQEAIAVKSVEENRIIVLTVCDNDDGSSDVYEIELRINQK